MPKSSDLLQGTLDLLIRTRVFNHYHVLHLEFVSNILHKNFAVLGSALGGIGFHNRISGNYTFIERGNAAN